MALKNIVQKIVLLLVAIIAFETWCLEGLLRPLVVPGGSMAETLLGTHRKVVCEDCGFEFNRGIESDETALRAVCHNCGHTGNDISQMANVSGDRVLMYKSAFLFRRPRVWEVVAFRDPAQANRITVKRVVGLPGETISIKHGDLYANGKIRRKPLWLQRAMAVLVHDAGYSTDRWNTDGEDSQWKFTDGQFTHPKGLKNDKTQWLTYCHGWLSISTAEGGCSTSEPQPKTAIAKPKTLVAQPKTLVAQPPSAVIPKDSKEWIPSPVTDLSGYNQTRPRRAEDIHRVDDLMLSLRVLDLAGHGSMSIRARDAQGEFLIKFTIEQPAENVDSGNGKTNSPTGLRQASLEIWRDGQPLEHPGKKVILLPGDFTIEVSLFDQCLLLAVDGKMVVEYPYDREPPSANRQNKPQDGSRPLAFGCHGLGLTLKDVRVYRDIFYTNPFSKPRPAGTSNPKKPASEPLDSDEYYVLGDNSPISRDSRNWPCGPALPAKLLVGKPLAVFLPSRVLILGGRQFQVPDIGRIRYIR